MRKTTCAREGAGSIKFYMTVTIDILATVVIRTGEGFLPLLEADRTRPHNRAGSRRPRDASPVKYLLTFPQAGDTFWTLRHRHHTRRG